MAWEDVVVALYGSRRLLTPWVPGLKPTDRRSLPLDQGASHTGVPRHHRRRPIDRRRANRTGHVLSVNPHALSAQLDRHSGRELGDLLIVFERHVAHQRQPRHGDFPLPLPPEWCPRAAGWPGG